MNNENDIYYNRSKCMSYNMYLNMIDSGRGIGKTTTFCIGALQDFANKGDEFIYLRRYEPEMKEFVEKNTLNNIVEEEIVTKGGKKGYTFFTGDETIGYGMLLSTAAKLKSVQFPKVKTIIFDEYILLPGGTYHYLKKEVINLLEFASTVFRTRKGGKIILLGNNLDLFNPYFEFFNIPMFDTIYTNKERGIYCEHAKHSPKLIEMEKETELYKLTKGTAYGDYHYDNKVLMINKVNITTKPKDARLLCRAVINGYTLNFYLFNDKNTDLCVYCEFRNKVIKDNITYELLNNAMPNYWFISVWRKKFRPLFERKMSDNKFYFGDNRASNAYQWIKEKI